MALQEQKSQQWWFSIRGRRQGLETFLVVTSGEREAPGIWGQRPGMPLHILPCTGQPPLVPFLGPQPPPRPWPGKTGRAGFPQEWRFQQEHNLETSHSKQRVETESESGVWVLYIQGLSMLFSRAKPGVTSRSPGNTVYLNHCLPVLKLR